MSEIQKPRPCQEELKLPRSDTDNVGSAYTQFIELARNSQNMLLSSQLAWAENAMAVQGLALGFAKANANANIGLMSELSHAGNLTDCLEIQARFARRQGDVLGQQAEKLRTLMVTSSKTNGLGL